MNTLPKATTRSIVISFWSVLALFVFAAACVGYWLILPSMILPAAGLTFAAVIVVLLIAGSEVLVTGYVYVNGFIRIKAVPLAQRWVAGVAYYTVVLVNRRYAGRLVTEPAKSGGTMWHACGSRCSPRSPEGGDGIVEIGEDYSLTGDLIRWIKDSKSWWVIGLIPFMLILSALQTDQRTAPSSDTYTLY